MIKRTCLVISILIGLVLTFPPPSFSDHAFRVLILHSYSMDYQWTKGLQQGIEDGLRTLSPEIHLRVELMDTKNFFNRGYLEKLATIYREKYAQFRLDGIIVTDNNALGFVERYGEEIFPGVPVVACGINYAQPPQPGSQVKSILAEESDHIGTIRQALNYWPQGENLYVVYDETPTGAHIAREVEQSLRHLDLSIQTELVTGKTLEELKQFVSTRRTQDLVYLLPFFRDAKGQAYAQGHAAREMARVSTVPILASWSFQVGSGALGGHVLSAHHIGELASQTLFKIMEGEEVEAFQSDLSVFESFYDYDIVKQFGIKEGLLPRNALFINKPLGFYDKHGEVLRPAAVVVSVLSILVVLMAMNWRKQKVINTANQRIIALDEEVIETQRELVSTLGEVIEARSNETGNHVKRVAKISRLIGEKIGLSVHDLDLLEAASPMHDVGKIGIPDHVLNKYGRLTDEEFELIKTHTDIGKELLGSSDRELLKVAGTIAHQHHERWDGSGYPKGLKGEEISILARITMLADIYDALLSERTYKKAWTEDKVLSYIDSESGKYFDPYLVDVFMASLNEARAIRARYSADGGSRLH